MNSLEFYVRQSKVPEMGEKGLALLRSKTVAVVGTGGVGSALAYYLVRSGLGRVRLIDQDIVEPSNLQRIHSALREDLYQPKAEVLARRLSDFDPDTRIEPVVDSITRENAQSLLEGVDLILDGLDNFRTRYILNHHAAMNRVPFLFVSAAGRQAHISLLNPPCTAGLECTMPQVKDRIEESCETLGVTPSIIGLIGALGAETAMQFILHQNSPLAGRMLTIDAATADFPLTKCSKRDDCNACTRPPRAAHEEPTRVTLLCGEHTANVVPAKAMSLNLSKLSSTIPPKSVLTSSHSVLVYRRGPHIISLFRTGRVLIESVEDEATASTIADSIWRDLRATDSVQFEST